MTHFQKTEFHASGEIRTRNPRKQAAASHPLDVAATGMGIYILYAFLFSWLIS